MILMLKYLTIAIVAMLVALMLYAGEPGQPRWWLAAIPFALWIAGPAATAYFVARRFGERRWVLYLMAAFLVVSTAWAAGEYYRAFFVSTSSTSALVMIFVPLYQWAALLGLILLSGAIMALRNTKSRG